MRARSIPLLFNGSHPFSLRPVGPGTGKENALVFFNLDFGGYDLICLFAIVEIDV